MHRVTSLLLLTLLSSGCARLQRLWPLAIPADERLAHAVTIARDEWGVPTIYGATDAAVAFGAGYVQAEDNLWQIEEDLIHALGRAAYYYGEAHVPADLVQAAFEVERLSREEYTREPVQRKAIWDAFAAGINYYTRTHRAQHRLASVEPWMLFTRMRALEVGTAIDGIRLGIDSVPPAAGAGTVSRALVGVRDTAQSPADPGADSFVWAVAPARAVNGYALLVQSEHGAFFGHDQPYELQLHSESGWHVRGIALLGTPVPRIGYTEQLAWGHTRSAADDADVYEVTFDHPTDSLMYRYDGGWRRAESWIDTIWVNTAHGVVPRVHAFSRTHHGPVVAQRDGKALAVRLSRFVEGGALQQWYAMGRAATSAEFRAALALTALPRLNTVYVDRAGHMHALHGNAVPARAPDHDWSRPVDGATSATEWRGYHPPGELPQISDPETGVLPSSPRPDAPAASTFPAYMNVPGDHGRAGALRPILQRDSAWSFEQLVGAAFDTFVPEAENAIASLVRAWEEIGGTNPGRAFPLDAPLDMLRAWDRMSTTESAAMTLFTHWQERLRTGEYQSAYRHFTSFEDAVARLQRDWDSAQVPWGEVNRLQRGRTPGSPVFNDDHHSLPVAGGPGWLGIAFNFITHPLHAGSKRRYGIAGARWISIVELGPEPRASAVVTFGQSAHPDSPHFFDQAPLYVRGALRPAPFTRAAVMAQARRVYQPARPAR